MCRKAPIWTPQRSAFLFRNLKKRVKPWWNAETRRPSAFRTNGWNWKWRSSRLSFGAFVSCYFWKQGSSCGKDSNIIPLYHKYVLLFQGNWLVELGHAILALSIWKATRSWEAGSIWSPAKASRSSELGILVFLLSCFLFIVFLLLVSFCLFCKTEEPIIFCFELHPTLGRFLFAFGVVAA